MEGCPARGGAEQTKQHLLGWETRAPEEQGFSLPGLGQEALPRQPGPWAECPDPPVTFPGGKDEARQVPLPRERPISIWRQMFSVFFLTKSSPPFPSDQTSLSPVPPGERLLRVRLQLLFTAQAR